MHQTYLEYVGMLFWRAMEISWANFVENDVLQKVKKGRNIAHTIKRKADWIGHFLHRNCLLKHFIEGKTRKMT
jgi:hypothetical protein